MIPSRCFRLALLFVAVSVPAFAQQPIGEVFASDATVHGSVQLTGGGAQVLSGASVTAGDAAARLKLARGGELRLCPQTSVAATASASGRELMFSMGTGAIEADYRLTDSADTIMTPDFRILLAGPGTFRFALRSGANGDTCVETRASNNASVVVTEVMGDGTYQIKPNERIVFRKGKLADPEQNPAEDCGCPAPAPVLKAEAATPAPAPTPAPVLMATAPETPAAAATAPAPDPTATHVEVDSPFVFRAEDSPLRHAPARESLASLPALPVVEPLPPPELQASLQSAAVSIVPGKPKKKSVFARMGAFFANIFK